MKQEINLVVNDKPCKVEVDPQTTLLEVLRDSIGFTGAKAGCGTGHCGACTVLADGEPVLSCLTLAITTRDSQITTIEGLSKGDNLHPLQKTFIDFGAIQCGFCTPGMILSAKALLDKNPDPTRDDVAVAISGNLCRCTGYVKIIDAVIAAARITREESK